MKRINGYTPQQYAFELTIGWMREIHAGRTGDLASLTESQRQEVLRQLAKLHNHLLSISRLDGLPL